MRFELRLKLEASRCERPLNRVESNAMKSKDSITSLQLISCVPEAVVCILIDLIIRERSLLDRTPFLSACDDSRRDSVLTRRRTLAHYRSALCLSNRLRGKI